MVPDPGAVSGLVGGVSWTVAFGSVAEPAVPIGWVGAGVPGRAAVFLPAVPRGMVGAGAPGSAPGLVGAGEAAGAPGRPGLMPLLVGAEVVAPTGELDVASLMVGAACPGLVAPPAVFSWIVGAGLAAAGAFLRGAVALGGSLVVAAGDFVAAGAGGFGGLPGVGGFGGPPAVGGVGAPAGAGGFGAPAGAGGVTLCGAGESFCGKLCGLVAFLGRLMRLVPRVRFSSPLGAPGGFDGTIGRVGGACASSDEDGAAGGASEALRVTRTVSFISGTLEVCFEGGFDSGS